MGKNWSLCTFVINVGYLKTRQRWSRGGEAVEVVERMEGVEGVEGESFNGCRSSAGWWDVAAVEAVIMKYQLQ